MIRCEPGKDGRRYAFRYLADGGRWFNDDLALRGQQLGRRPHGTGMSVSASKRLAATVEGRLALEPSAAC